MTLTIEQLRERKQGIGSSDVAAVLGLSPYRGPHDVWADKTSDDVEQIDNVHTRFGNMMEPVMIAWYAEQNPEWTVIPNRDENGDQVITTHPDLPWAKATQDAIAFCGERRKLVEIKTASWTMADKWGEEGTDEIPDEYMAQVIWQMFVLDIDSADVVVLLDKEPRIYHVQRRMDVERGIAAKVGQFWRNYVLTKTPPPVDGSEACFANLGRRNNGKVYLEGVADLDHLMTAAAAAKALKEKAEAEEKLIRAQIMERVGDDWKGYKGDAGSIYWVERKPSIKEDPKAMLSLLRSKGVTQEELDSVYREVPGSKYVTFRPSKEK